MYQYDQHDRAFLADRVALFRDQVARRLTGVLSEEQFRPLRLQNGLYLQLHAYMLRVAVPYGTLNGRQLRALAAIARRYDRGYGHFTTRQNIQFNWIRLADAPDIMADLAAADLHAIQTSGDCIRNVTADQWAGAARDEIEDPRIWCEIIRQWSTVHPEFSFLPRKFKIAVTGAARDRAAVRFHDIGLRLLRNADGEVGFEVLVGGGLGRTPVIGKVIRPFLPKAELLAYLEAIMRVYNRHGRRDNPYKARIKILVNDLGSDEMRRQVEAEWEGLRGGDLRLDPDLVAEIAGRFAGPALTPDPAPVRAVEDLPLIDPAFRRWLDANTVAHRVPGHRIVNLPLKPIGAPPGDASAAQMEALADLAETYGHDDVRVTHEQNLVLPHVREGDLPALWRALDGLGLAVPNLGLVSDIIACPGLDYCTLANARSIPVAQAISTRFADLARQQDIGELRIKISGCINACAHHHVGHIGILGVEKAGAEFYQVTLGGEPGEGASIGELVGPAIPAARIVAAVETIIAGYLAFRRPGERFLDTVRRVGVAPFRERLDAAA
ncbi:MAG: nitrite/sulfite reductase [Alphaproteobacteria bacterium]|nr:nitrite/sulfite reductase [Alphaproteobacteria bacterium]